MGFPGGLAGPNGEIQTGVCVLKGKSNSTSAKNKGFRGSRGSYLYTVGWPGGLSEG